jgi:hypothetical protein
MHSIHEGLVMSAENWAAGMPMQRIRTGVSINLKLDIYSDGRGHLYCADDTSFSVPVPDRRALQAAIRDLWERGVSEAATRNPFAD